MSFYKERWFGYIELDLVYYSNRSIKAVKILFNLFNGLEVIVNDRTNVQCPMSSSIFMIPINSLISKFSQWHTSTSTSRQVFRNLLKAIQYLFSLFMSSVASVPVCSRLNWTLKMNSQSIKQSSLCFMLYLNLINL